MVRNHVYTTAARRDEIMTSIFSRIIAGEIPGHFVWKDDTAVAFLTIEPFREGHVLVVPREEIDHWDDLPDPTAAHLMIVSRRIARALKSVFPCKRIGMLIAGLEVPHTHLHIVPIDALAELSFERARPAKAEDLAGTAARIREALRSQGNREADF